MRIFAGCLLVTAACFPAESPRARGTLDLVAYVAALDACRARGKAEHAYAVYEGCADAVDVKFGRQDGGAP